MTTQSKSTNVENTTTGNCCKYVAKKAISTATFDVQGKSRLKVKTENTKMQNSGTAFEFEIRNLAIRLPDIEYEIPIRVKIVPVMIEWWCQENVTRDSVDVVAEISRRNVTPMCTIERFATIFFASFVAPIAIVPITAEIIPTIRRNSSDDVATPDATRNVIKPTVANFSAYPARTTLPGHVAST
jgi:hypothetical protein